MTDNFDEEFRKLTAQLEDIPDPEIAISLFDISATLGAVHEACSYLGEFLTLGLSISPTAELEFPENLITVIPHFRRVAEAIADEMHILLCEACRENDHDENCECHECESDEEGE